MSHQLHMEQIRGKAGCSQSCRHMLFRLELQCDDCYRCQVVEKVVEKVVYVDRPVEKVAMFFVFA